MLVQMIDILDHAALARAADADVVDHREMLHIFAQSYAAGMRTNRQIVLRRHEHYGQDFVDAEMCQNRIIFKQLIMRPRRGSPLAKHRTLSNANGVGPCGWAKHGCNASCANWQKGG